MTDQEMLLECIKDWSDEKLSGDAAMQVVSMIVDPQPVTDEDIRWALDKLEGMGL